MNSKIEKMKCFRMYLLKQLESLTTQQLNNIPEKFSNNIIWNLGHMISAQQTMCYVRSGISNAVTEFDIAQYAPGTKPSGVVSVEDVEKIKKAFLDSIDRLHADYNANVFQQYSPSVMIPKVYGFEVRTIDEALDYLLHHEGYHAGLVTMLMKLC